MILPSYQPTTEPANRQLIVEGVSHFLRLNQFGALWHTQNPVHLPGDGERAACGGAGGRVAPPVDEHHRTRGDKGCHVPHLSVAQDAGNIVAGAVLLVQAGDDILAQVAVDQRHLHPVVQSRRVHGQRPAGADTGRADAGRVHLGAGQEIVYGAQSVPDEQAVPGAAHQPGGGINLQMS